MSFCRWSSMNWKCDLYCYESERGLETIVAGRRVIGPVPTVDIKGFLEYKISVEEYMQQGLAQHQFMEDCSYESIGLKYDGQHFLDDKETFLSTLTMLREEGYIFPEITQEDIDD